MKAILTMLAAAWCAATPVAAQDDGYGAPGPNYYFYGPSTNYFGASGAADYAPPAYGAMPAYYGGFYGGDDWDNPPEAYDAIRQDPWHGYNDGWDNGY